MKKNIHKKCKIMSNIKEKTRQINVVFFLFGMSLRGFLVVPQF